MVAVVTDEHEQCWADVESTVISTGNQLLSTCNKQRATDIGLCDECFERLVGTEVPVD